MGPLAPSIPHEAVMIARGRAASMRWARDCAANPPKTAAWMAPRRVIASAAMSAAGIMGTAWGQPAMLDGSEAGEHTIDNHDIALAHTLLPQHTRQHLHLIE